MRASPVLVVSLVVHAGLALGIGTLRAERARRGPTAISMAEQKKKPPPPKPVDAPPPKPAPDLAPPVGQAKAKAAPAEPKPAAEAPKPGAAPAMDSIPDFGLTLGGGSGPGGLAIPSAGGVVAGDAAAKPAQATRAAAPPPKPLDDCAEPIVKPKPESVPQPAYNEAARAEGIAGRVRVEVSVDAHGKVSSARLLSGLGHGLDEAALAAARAASFSPATKCGKPTATTFVIAMRFSL